jgi:hypothetical protein
MKKTIFVLSIITIIHSYTYCQSKKENEPCESWYVEPFLYNELVSDSTIVKYWENYWYYRSGDTTKLIPDTLIIRLSLNPSMVTYTDNLYTPNSTYVIKSTLQLKYSDTQESYNVVNYKLTDTIILLNKEVNLNTILKVNKQNERCCMDFYPEGIPLKEILDRYNVYIFDKPIDYNSGKLYFLNQLIINTYFIDKKDNIKCKSEFIFPVNGAYGNEKGCCKWGF